MPLYAKHQKPATCSGCPLSPLSRGYVPADGGSAPILLLGESPWMDEIAQGIPFAGAAGSMLQRVLRRNGWTRESVDADNVLRCAPPHLEFARESWLRGAVDHCRQHTQPSLESHQVVAPLGNLAIRRTLDLWGPKIRVEDFHGTVQRDPSDQFWVVPSFHPSYLQRGAVNLMGVVSFDLRRAHEVARSGWEPDPMELVVDPSLEYVEAWADRYLAAVAQSPEDIWLAVDVETDEKAGKDEATIGPLTPEQQADKVTVDRSYRITRLNLSCHPDEGLTFPFTGRYIAIAQRVLASAGRKLLWFADYDWPRLEAAHCPLAGEIWDLPWGAHLLQSDIPLGLGFWAPFYSRYGAWKHLSESDPATYAAIDGPQTLRVGYGIVADLVANGQWATFVRHVHTLKQRVLMPAHNVGVRIDRPRLEAFEDDLTAKARTLQDQIQDVVPETLRPLTGGNRHADGSWEGLKAQPLATLHTHTRTTNRDGTQKKQAPDRLKQELFEHARVVERIVVRTVRACLTCGQLEVQTRHRCKDEQGAIDRSVTPRLAEQPATVRRWFWQEPFNPSSWQQLLQYIKHKQHSPGRAKATGKESTDRETLERLSRTTTDPLYDLTLKLRAVNKVRSTYVLGVKKRLDSHDRVHPAPTFRPSTQRLSYIDPNITNVITDRGGKESLAAGFRRCIVPGVGRRLLEIDFSAIEAVLTGWLADDPDYVRLARLGVHAALASHVLKRPYDPTWSDADLAAYFLEIKQRDPIIYDRAKRCVHGNAYGLTEYGMVRTFPETFPNLQTARRYRDLFFELAPKVRDWQHAVQTYADEHGYLGGMGEDGQPGRPPFGSPFGYRHWFWSVYSYTRITARQAQNARVRAAKQGKTAAQTEVHGIWYRIGLGEDAKRCVAFLPQSTAAGILKETMWQLFADPDADSYLGAACDGETPLRAPIHDSILLEVPTASFDQVLETACRVMRQPWPMLPLPASWGMGDALSLGVEAKAGAAGASWAELERVELGGETTAADRTFFPAEEGEEEEEQDLGVVA